MARFTKKRATKDDARKVLGGVCLLKGHERGWDIIENNGNGRPYARSVFYRGDCAHTRSDLAPNTGIQFRTADNQVIADKFLWPTSLDCKIDLADLYVDEKRKLFRHPLHGFPIKKLVEASKYPFYDPARVTIIFGYFANKTLALNSSLPNAVLFIECWSHFDVYDTAAHESPAKAFKIPTTAGALWTEQIEDQDAHVGKNFIILPFGYCYDKSMEEQDRFTPDEWDELCTKNVAEWNKIIQDFLEGNETTTVETAESETAPDSQNAKADSGNQNTKSISAKSEDTTEDVTPPISPTEPSLAIPSLAEWQEKQRVALRDRFLCRSHIKLCEEIDCILQERADQNGVQIYQIAPPDSRTDSVTDTGLFTEMICINDIWYRVTNFLYCREHYAAFKQFLDNAEKKDLEIQAKIDELDQ